MNRSLASLSAAILLVGSSATASWAGCACGISECGSGFSMCWFDDAGHCVTVSGNKCVARIAMIAGADVVTVVVNDPQPPAAKYAYAGCNRTLAERSYTAAEAQALRAATHQIAI